MTKKKKEVKEEIEFKQEEVVEVNNEISQEFTDEKNEQENEQQSEVVKPKRKRKTKKQLAEEKAAAEMAEFIDTGEVEHHEKEKTEQLAIDFTTFEPEVQQQQEVNIFQEETDVFQEDREERTSKKKRTSKKAKPEAQHITGYMLLLAVDLVVPVALNILIPKTKNKNLKLTPEELSNLAPFADAAAAQMEVQMSPVTMFFIFTGTIYAGKLM